jgi:tRNA1Val (adenine37-N6)-methyltransferase
MSDIVLMSDERLDRVNENLMLIQKKDGLTFGTDAFLLAAFIKQKKNCRAAELGAGTGIISLLCATKEKLLHIDAYEIQEDFAHIARRNVELNGLCEHIRVINEDVRNIKPHKFGGEVDVVFSNPPYMKTTSGKKNESERKYIARHEVCGDIGDFCAAAYRLLKHGGSFYCVWRPDRLTSLICELRKNSLEPKKLVFVHSNESAEPSMVLVCATKGGAEGIRVSPPLFLNEAVDKDGRCKMTARAEQIYETMSFGD